MLDERTAPRSLLDQFRLDGRTAIITGIGPGIGSHVAEAYAAAGANVVIAARTAEKVHKLADAINASGGNALAVPADVGKKEELERLIEATQQRFGVVDIVFHNAAAGSGRRAGSLEEDDEDWLASVNVNLLAPFRLAKALVPGMRAKGRGSIINVLTTAAFNPVITITPPEATLPFAAYGATKAGLAMFTRYLAKWCGPEVRANAICPGTISSDDIVRDVWKPLMQSIPMGRIGKAEEVIGAALFLASDASSYITGQVVFVDGGRVNTVS